MNCVQCNTTLPDDAAFCPQCGNPIATLSTIATLPIFASDPLEQELRPGNNLLFGCISVIGVLLIAIAFVGFVAHNKTVETPLKRPEAPTFEIGTDFPLYGKTLGNKDFDWKGLRGKYVLVKFTATWCGPCKEEIPSMLEAYKKYHDKGLEIVSVYIGERGPNADATVREFVKEEGLPWIIISESLSVKAGLPPQSGTFGIQGVPTMLLVDKEGQILATGTRGTRLEQELKKLFDN